MVHQASSRIAPVHWRDTPSRRTLHVPDDALSGDDALRALALLDGSTSVHPASSLRVPVRSARTPWYTRSSGDRWPPVPRRNSGPDVGMANRRRGCHSSRGSPPARNGRLHRHHGPMACAGAAQLEPGCGRCSEGVQSIVGGDRLQRIKPERTPGRHARGKVAGRSPPGQRRPARSSSRRHEGRSACRTRRGGIAQPSGIGSSPTGVTGVSKAHRVIARKSRPGSPRGGRSPCVYLIGME